jgi:hypothetical protein
MVVQNAGYPTATLHGVPDQKTLTSISTTVKISKLATHVYPKQQQTYTSPFVLNIISVHIYLQHLEVVRYGLHICNY